MIRDSKPVVNQTLNEIGFYSTLLADTESNTELLNYCYSLLMRTKQTGVDEGGVNAGFSVLDSPFITDLDDLNNIKPVFKSLN
jgi:glutathione synthase